MDQFIFNNPLFALLMVVTGMAMWVSFVSGKRLLLSWKPYRFRIVLGLVLMLWSCELSSYFWITLPQSVERMIRLNWILESLSLWVCVGYGVFVLEILHPHRLRWRAYWPAMAFCVLFTLLQIVVCTREVYIAGQVLMLLLSVSIALYAIINAVKMNRTLAQNYATLDQINFNRFIFLVIIMSSLVLLWTLFSIVSDVVLMPGIQSAQTLDECQRYYSIDFILSIVFEVAVIAAIVMVKRVALEHVNPPENLDFLRQTEYIESVAMRHPDPSDNAPRVESQRQVAFDNGESPVGSASAQLQSDADQPAESKESRYYLGQVDYDREIRTRSYYTDPDITLTKLASLLGTNRSYLSAYINTEMKSNFCDYINNMRLDQVMEQLREDSGRAGSMVELSQDCGFKSYSTFLRAFQKRYGSTPTAYLRDRDGH